MKANILILDDNKSVLTALELLLQKDYENVICLNSPNNLLGTLQIHHINVVLLDMNFKAGVNTGNEGIYWLHEIHKYDPNISVIMITAYGDIELAVKALKEGAFDFILKPWENHKLLSTIHGAVLLSKTKAESASLRRTTQNLKQHISQPAKIAIGRSEAMEEVMDMVRKVATTDANILITGENGTGKELIAREIHSQSRRNQEVFLSIDMGAISETLFESELFGHTKGSFTDAKDERIGKFETAHKGSLFLDEIGNLPLAMQAKLLTALQNRTITKIGSSEIVPIDIRLISATNKNLDDMIASDLFREDLMYRINTITIEVPPLRQRGNDILLLADFYLKKYAAKYEKYGLKLNQKASQKLLSYHWPGNVRELQHSMEKAVILADSTVLDENSFTLYNRPQNLSNSISDLSLKAMEREMIRTHITNENRNMSAVADKLGITRQTLYNKIKKYGL